MSEDKVVNRYWVLLWTNSCKRWIGQIKLLYTGITLQSRYQQRIYIYWLVYATVKKKKEKEKELQKKVDNWCVIWNTVWYQGPPRGRPLPPSPNFMKKKRKQKKYTFSNERNLWWNKNIRLADLVEASKFMIGPFRSYIIWWSSLKTTIF